MEALWDMFTDTLRLGLWMGAPAAALITAFYLFGSVFGSVWYWIDDKEDFGEDFWVLIGKITHLWKNSRDYDDAGDLLVAWLAMTVVAFLGLLFWAIAIPTASIIGFCHLLRHSRRWQKKVNKALENVE
jgi:hypothetical protein